ALVAIAVWGLRHSIGMLTLWELVVIIPSIILHEVSHGVVALACGDDTAKRAGRLTLNPIKHIDPVGTLVLPAVLALTGLGTFGYAKPVPINPRRMRHPRNDSILVGLAGPATNLVLAGLSIIALRAITRPAIVHRLPQILSLYGPGFLGVPTELLYLLGLLNVVLAVFNALPIPPLDGSNLVERLLPSSALPAWWQVRRFAMLALLLLVLWDPHGFLGHVFTPAENAWARVLSA
ncbi:MAG: site-2 protease family protein, partial [Acidimicrobiales bacterium]